VSFRLKIMAVVAGTILAAIIVLAYSSNQITSHRVQRFLKATDAESHDGAIPAKLIQSLQQAYRTGGWSGAEAVLKHSPNQDYVLINTSGQTVASNRDAFKQTSTTVMEGSWIIQSEINSMELRVNPATLPPLAVDGALIGYILKLPTIRPRASEDTLSLSINRSVWIAAAVIALIAITLAHLITKQALSPLRLISGVIEKLRQGDDAVTVPVSGSDEFAEIGESLNLLLSEQRHSKQVRQSLLADLAHELRTPLTGLRCQTETLVDGLKPATPENLEAMLDSVLHIQAIYNDLEALALADADQLPFTQERFDLIPFLAACCSASQARAGSVTVRFEEGEEPLYVNADKVRLRQVVQNILSNALCFSPKDGTVSVSLSGDVKQAHIDILDQGIGIAEEHESLIFERFYRIDPARNPNEGGHGLGLAIARQLLALMEGSIALKNPSAKGAHFRITLPRR